MTKRRTITSFCVAAGTVLAGGLAVAAINEPEMRELSAPSVGTGMEVQPMGERAASPREAPRRAAAPEGASEVRGNPLWAVPLSSLTATRERPLFLPSRRPPAPVVAGPPPAPPPAPPARAPEPPQLRMVGAVVGEGKSIAVFLDGANNPVRLRTGQAHAGWLLQQVRGREAVLRKDRETAVLAMPTPDAIGPAGPMLAGTSIPVAMPVMPPPVAAMPPGVPGLPPGVPFAGNPRGAPVAPALPVPPAVMPTIGSGYVPFTPRSTPRNGESDGL